MFAGSYMLQCCIGISYTFPLPFPRQECASLRLELSQRHSDDSQSALSELASLKDAAFREARDEWEKERDGLLRKVRRYHCRMGL